MRVQPKCNQTPSGPAFSRGTTESFLSHTHGSSPRERALGGSGAQARTPCWALAVLPKCELAEQLYPLAFGLLGNNWEACGNTAQVQTEGRHRHTLFYRTSLQVTETVFFIN